MTSWDGQVKWRNLEFFGKVSASISHEIKNALAVMNESAGLLEDLVAMVRRGGTLDVERVGKAAAMIRRQVERTDHIVKNMNRFAHSVDEPVMPVDVTDVTGLMVALGNRRASSKAVAVRHITEDGPVTVTTNLFLLEDILWSCLGFALEAAGEGGELDVLASRQGPGALIVFKGLRRGGENTGRPFPDGPVSELAGSLGAEVSRQDDGATIALKLPKEAPAFP